MKLLQGVSLESGHDLHNYLRVSTFTSRSSALQKLADMLPLLRSRLGALLFLISALLSRGLVLHSTISTHYFVFSFFGKLLSFVLHDML